MTFKKRVGVSDGGYFIPPRGFFFYPHPLYDADPMLIIYPLNLKGYMISMGSAAQRGI